MKIWHIKRMDDIGFDEFDEKIVLAHSKDGAREVAALRNGDEGASPWLDPGRSIVTEVRTDEDHECIVLGSFRAG